jgi:hypothetical protein
MSNRKYKLPNLGESSVIPNITVMGKTVADESKFAFLDILLYGIEELVFRDLHLGIGPSRNLDDHVEDTVPLVGEKRDIVEWGYNSPILLDKHTMFWTGREARCTRSARVSASQFTDVAMTRTKGVRSSDETRKILCDEQTPSEIASVEGRNTLNRTRSHVETRLEGLRKDLGLLGQSCTSTHMNG